MKRDRLRRDIRQELEHHLESTVVFLRQRGWPEERARAEAMRRLGALDDVVENLVPTAIYRQRRMRLRDWLAAAAHDVRYAARSLARQPGLTLTIVLTLALGIGANGTIFPVVDRLLFRMPSGVSDPEGVRRLYATSGSRAEMLGSFPYPEIADLRAAAHGSARIAGYMSSFVSVAGDTAQRRRVGIAYVTEDYAQVLGLRTLAGRWFTPEELDPGHPRLVGVLTEWVWRTRFGADPAVIGREERIGARRFTIIGIVAGFEGLETDPTGVLAPIGLQRSITTSSGNWWELRTVSTMRVLLRPTGTVPDAVLASMLASRARPATGTAPVTPSQFTLGSILPSRSLEKSRQEPQIAARLAGVSLILLLIAIANVTNLLLARSSTREREIAVRRALGISAGRLMMLFFVEASLLALLAAAAAALCGALLGGVFRTLLLPNINWTPPMFDLRTVGFTLSLALACALAAGLLPAFHFSRAGFANPLRAGAGHGARGAGWVRTALLTAQAALSAVLLVGAGLFVTSLDRVRKVDVGYSLDGLVSVAFNAAEQSASAIEGLRAKVAALSGVRGVAAASVTPLRGISQHAIYLASRDSAVNDDLTPDLNAVSPNFFTTLGLPIVRGRGFTEADNAGTAPVMIVNEEAARRLWPGRNPLGECVRLDRKTEACRTVIGVARNAHRTRIVEETPGQAYVLLSQSPAFPGGSLVIRGDNPVELGRMAERQVSEALGPKASPSTFTYTEWLEPQLRPWRLGARLFSGIAILSLGLALVGLYSVLAFAVARRRQEIGVRVALGARASDVARLVVRQGVTPVLAGVMLGLTIALAASGSLAAILYRTSTRDPFVYGSVGVVVILAGLLAALVPAWRAGRLDAMEALRSE